MLKYGKRWVFFWKNINIQGNILGLINRAELIDGLPFVNMKDFIVFKKKGFRKKDKKDVKLAEEYLVRRHQ